MENKVIHHDMVKRYNAGAFTHNYIFGFIRNGAIYAVEVRNAENLLPFITYIEKRSAGWALKYRPNKAMQEVILANAEKVKVLGSAEWFETEKVKHKNNRGNCFEDLVTKLWDGTQPENPNTKFTEGGDFTANGVAYQVKFGCAKGAATFTDEKTLNNLGL